MFVGELVNSYDGPCDGNEGETWQGGAAGWRGGEDGIAKVNRRLGHMVSAIFCWPS